ncbi:interferon-induced, double-stranded RNA-activated protein kinase [Python bivittatus]|uniref:non-specific serine/threonine protein kinase n=1 Tax=Python bivittatus TaxID=176946 RepID=A0A9F5J0R9_PYTBI|nr:interferon-induced, double-stranded RNA-activated protein kinase [Python bivittatus]XP_025027342.1 interferon-induced, double-stranded RNA-activated protein kinase [Python bivittatus]XP_025027343.1 interferon-induced, double-stranded RNA-activated protein kinase [Python bivittatus]
MSDNHHDSRTCMAKLNEHCQKNSLKLEYKDIAIRGPPHNRIFTVAVVIDMIQYSPASGKSKKEAKAVAAKLAWDAIEKQKKAMPDSREQHQEPSPVPSYLPPPQPAGTSPAAGSPEVSSSNSVNYVSLLNEYALKKKVPVQYNQISKTGLEHIPVFSYVCQIGDKIFDVGTGSKVQIAKLEAARLAYEKLSSPPTFRAEESANPVNDSLDMLSISFRKLSSRASENGTDLDSELKCTSDTFTEHTDVIQPNESSPFQVSPSNPAVKSKRKAPLAARFSNSLGRKSEFTLNDRFLDDFEEIKKIGSGGFGNVFKAKHITDDKLYAVKRIRLSGKKEERKREAKALAALKHPHIVQYFTCWIGQDTFQSCDTSDSSSELFDCLFIQMELCEKGNLAKWIQRMGMSPCKDDSIIIFQQIVEGVNYIHSENFIHRDLKPLNIFFYKDNGIKIGDFGLVTSGVKDFSVQRTMNKGTVPYMAPEQETSSYDKEVDIFPLGLILYEMLFPFPTDHEKYKEWHNIREGKLPETFIKKFTKEASLIKKLLSKEPSQRPSAADLLTFLGSQPYSRHTR